MKYYFVFHKIYTYLAEYVQNIILELNNVLNKYYKIFTHIHMSLLSNNIINPVINFIEMVRREYMQ